MATISSAELIYCTKCRRRPAVFKRVFSGEKYCFSCLYDVVYKRFKRNLSRSMVLKPGSRIGLVIPSFFIAESALALEYLVMIEKKYGSVITLFFMSKEDFDLFTDLVEIDYDVVREGYVMRGWKPFTNLYESDGIVGLWRFFRRVFLGIGGKVGVNALVAPVCHDFLALLETTSFLQGQIDGLGETRLVLSGKNGSVAFINGFHGVPCIEISFLVYKKYALLYLRSLFAGRLLNKNIYDVYADRILRDSIGVESGEILFSLHKTSEWILGDSLRKNICRFCGGYASRGDACIWCVKGEKLLEDDKISLEKVF